MKKILYGLMMLAMAQIAAFKLPPAAPAAYKMRFENATQSNIVVKFEYGACGATQSPRIKRVEEEGG